jgi:hypothetical protein
MESTWLGTGCKKRPFPVGRHGDGIAKNAAILLEIAGFMKRCYQLPLPMAGRTS